MHAPGDVRVEVREDPTIVEPTDAIIRVTATCICGSDLWPYRGVEELNGPTPMGHEYVGVVEQVGDQVSTIKVGDYVVGSFVASDGTCEICQAGYQSRCIHNVMMGSVGTQAELAQIPLADGTLVATPGVPDAHLIPSLMAASDVLGTDGSPPWPRTPARARRSPSLVTARWDSWRSWPQSNSAPSGSSR
jgi:threonine dehydrogenase-like Zn-dependent dehydrogenase